MYYGNNMKNVSVYVKGDRNSTAYYRIYQYLDNIEDVKCKYRMMMSPYIHNRYMPISKQSIWIKIYTYLHIYVRMLIALVKDVIFPPNVIVIHRRIISRFMPLSYRCLLILLKYRQTKIIWDFDDNITESREVSISTFRFYSRISNTIIVTHNFLKEMIPYKYQHKVMIMPTTDGDMYKYFEHNALNKQRLLDIDKELRLVWVATSSNLKYLNEIIPILEKTALEFYERNLNLKLNVVCDFPLQHSCKYLCVENIKWTRDSAINAMKYGHIGLMPLANNLFTKGKGGFKLVQYMSIGLPCIGSNVGYNSHVLYDGAGILVNTNQDWEDAIKFLSTKEIWTQYSIKAYNRWKTEFAYESNLDKWKCLFAID